MNPLLMPFGFLISLALGLTVFGVTGTLDRRALEQAEQQRLQLSLNVQAASFRGNLEKHRQGAVLIARHPGIIALASEPRSGAGQRVAKQLYALTDIDALMILDSEGMPLLIEPARSKLDRDDPEIAQAIAFARAGSLGRALIGNDYLFVAPVFKDRAVIAIAVSRFDLGEAASPLDLSTDEIRLLDFDGRELYANFRTGVGQRTLTLPLQDLSMVMVARPGRLLSAWEWAGGALGLAALAFAFACAFAIASASAFFLAAASAFFIAIVSKSSLVSTSSDATGSVDCTGGAAFSGSTTGSETGVDSEANGFFGCSAPLPVSEVPKLTATPYSKGGSI